MPQPPIHLPHCGPVTVGLAVTNATLCIQWSQARAAHSLTAPRMRFVEFLTPVESLRKHRRWSQVGFPRPAPGDGVGPGTHCTAGAPSEYGPPSVPSLSLSHLSLLPPWTQPRPSRSCPSSAGPVGSLSLPSSGSLLIQLLLEGAVGEIKSCT